MAATSNPLIYLWRRLPPPLRNRYFLVFMAFLFILIFVDKNNLWTQWRLRSHVRKLEQDREYYRQKIKEAQEEAADFEREQTREKTAREQYYMKRPNEDVYIIEER